MSRPSDHPSQASACGRSSRIGRLAIIAAISLQGLMRHHSQRSRYTGPMPAVRLRIHVNEAPMLWLNHATPMAPSHRRKRKGRPGRQFNEHYTTSAYDRAIERACRRAGIPHWAPNQLRHNAGTRIRAECGIEASRIILGHASAVTSELYAEADREKAKEIMDRLG